MFYTYILYSRSSDRYYVGHTNDIFERVARHNRGGVKFTSKGQPWELVHSEHFETKELAFARERQIKKWKSKIMIKRLINEAG